MISRNAATCLLVSLLAAVGLANSANAGPFGVRLTYTDDPAATIAISWNSDRADDASVIYGAAPDELTRSVTAQESWSMPEPLGRSFSAQLSGLRPETTYYYRVGRPGSYYPPQGEAPFAFTTLTDDPCAPLRFVVMGDNRADLDGMGVSPLWEGILDEALDQSPQFFINTGDMVKNGEDADEWEAFIETSEAGQARVPSIVTMGNHDEDDVFGNNAIYNRLFALPHNGRTDLEDYYAIEIGPLHIVSLSTQFTDPGSERLAQMVAWLREDLAATDRPWILVFFHKGIYSRGNHSSGEEDDGTINASFVPLFDEFDVDLVFSGHSHDYERYAPSVGVDREFGGTGRQFPAGDGEAVGGIEGPVPDGSTGTTYVITGGAGAFTADVFGLVCRDAACGYCTPINFNCPEEVFDNDLDGNILFDGRHNFVLVEVEADSLSATAFATETGNASSGIIDQWTMVSSDFPVDFCTPLPSDDGAPDAGGDAGPGDGGEPDAGPADSGPPDTGDLAPDAGEAPDTEEDTRQDDEPTVDSDAGTAPAQDTTPSEPESGCCRTAVSGHPGTPALAAVLLMALGIARRRRASR